MLVQDYLIDSAQRYPDKTAIVCGQDRVTYAELDGKTNQVARALVNAGVRRGDRAIVLLPNSIEAAVALFAILKAGAVFVPVNQSVKADKLASIVCDCAATAIITDAPGIRTIGETWSQMPSLSVVALTQELDVALGERRQLCFGEVFATESPRPLVLPLIDQDLACLIYTSGSTGESKGVVCGHNNVVFASGSIVSYLENVPDDIVINVLPFSFDYGLYQLLMVFRFTGTLVVENAFAYPAAILRTIEREKVTGLPAVPTLVSMLLKLDFSAFDLRSLRYISNTAAALHPAQIASLQQRLPNVRIYSMYGMTECKRTLYLPPARLADKPSSVGVAIPGTEVWIEDENGRRVGAGEIGELVVRGSHVMRGYWGDEALSGRTYRPGPTPGERVLHSGDLFRMDEEGLFYFVSRKDDIIKSRGEKVAPREVEAVICELNGVLETAVVGVPDEVLGQAIKAYVVCDGVTLTEKQVRRHCAARLENYMVPQQVEFVAQLAKTSSGKIDKQGLMLQHG